jgi:hypothetical protein
MPPRGPVRLQLEATRALDTQRQVVYLHVNGYRFVLEAPSKERANSIVVELARALGLDQGDV